MPHFLVCWSCPSFIMGQPSSVGRRLGSKQACEHSHTAIDWRWQWQRASPSTARRWTTTTQNRDPYPHDTAIARTISSHSLNVFAMAAYIQPLHPICFTQFMNAWSLSVRAMSLSFFFTMTTDAEKIKNRSFSTHIYWCLVSQDAWFLPSGCNTKVKNRAIVRDTSWSNFLVERKSFAP